MVHALVAEAERLVETVLWPDAAEVDRARRVPTAHFTALARAGLYGVETAAGLEPSDRWLITELLASGCMATAFVWLQHHSAVRALTGSENEPLRKAWLEGLVSGRHRAGIAIGGLRPPTPSLRASPTPDGWRLDGEVPWVTGWDMIDVLLVGAATSDDREVWALVAPGSRSGIQAQRRSLIAADASVTVLLRFKGFVVADDEIVGLGPRRKPDPGDGGGRSNGSLALGVVRRVASLIGPSPLDGELDAIRHRLDLASDAQMASARAAASELALRAAALLTVRIGSGAVDVEGPAQRLAREAQFTAVFGTRPAIRSELIALLTARAGGHR